MTEPRDFLVVGRNQVGLGPAEHRTGIGRAYYAGFNAGARFLRGIGCRIPKGPEAHADVRDILDASGLAELAGVAHDLASLRDQRNTADYDLDDASVESVATVEVAIQQAEDAIGALEEFEAKVCAVPGRYESILASMRAESIRRDRRRELGRPAR